MGLQEGVDYFANLMNEKAMTGALSIPSLQMLMDCMMRSTTPRHMIWPSSQDKQVN